jgi:ornithine cyclodeaminase/alanine dehydrogenase-like protein (mu-crystallin family)
VFDAVRERAERFVGEATPRTDVVGAVVVESAAAACDGADLLVSVVSSRALGENAITDDLLTPRCLVLCIDRAIMVTASVPASAGLFLVDDLAQFLYVRDAEPGGWYAGYPRPHGSLGRALVADERIASGRGGGVVGGLDDPDAVVASSGRDVAAALGGNSAGRVVLTCVGVGAVDVVTAGAVHRIAELEGIGDILDR